MTIGAAQLLVGTAIVGAGAAVVWQLRDRWRPWYFMPCAFVCLYAGWLLFSGATA